MSLADMKAELRELRKAHVKPVSRMRKGDISVELNKLREMRETTPAVKATPSASKKMLKNVVMTDKQANEEFPTVSKGKGKGVPEKKKGISKSDLMKMLADMSDSD
jgi:hypothetical protein